MPDDLRMTCSPETRQALGQLLRAEVHNLYALAYFIRGSRTDARKQLVHLCKKLLGDPEAARRVFHAERPGDQLIVEMVSEISGRQTKRKTEAAFVALDNLLRSELTRPVARDRLLLWELKRSCLTAALGCLPIALRVGFVLSKMTAWTDEQVARALGHAERPGFEPICCIQPMSNLAKRAAEIELLPMAHAESIAVIPYGPPGGGLLSAKYGPSARPPSGRWGDHPSRLQPCAFGLAGCQVRSSGTRSPRCRSGQNPGRFRRERLARSGQLGPGGGRVGHAQPETASRTVDDRSFL